MKVVLYNRHGQPLTEVTVNRQDKPIDGVQWGGMTFLWDSNKSQFRESLIVPAIIQKNSRKSV